MKKTDKEKLQLWKKRLSQSEAAYADELARMDGREAQYSGAHDLKTIVEGERTLRTGHVRNISAELIEAQVDSNIPQPKVVPRREKDEGLAHMIEDMLRNELDRMPFEVINDMAERTVPIQGGVGYLLEWDNTQRTHTTVGELSVTVLHPKQIIPQAGVVNIEDMDYIILKLPQTAEYIRRRYGADVTGERESEPQIRAAADAAEASDELVTQYAAYYRNDDGGIGLYSWVNDVQLEDLEDYQSRRARRCAVCGAREPGEELQPIEPTPDGSYPAGEDGAPVLRKKRGNVCPFCGSSKWQLASEDFEELPAPVRRTDGLEIGGVAFDADGQPVPERVPCYKPNVFPVILQRNVSVYGRFLGDSDLDKIADQQNTVNRIEQKIIDKLLKSGSYITLPNEARIQTDTADMKVIRIDNAAQKQLIGVYDLQGEITADLRYLAQSYEEARQVIGITDSFQGRKDATATSGKAKEFAAAQSAGRLESKRIMKNAAYAALFEAMFKFKLAYADEPRPVIGSSASGDRVYEQFNRWDFLERDAAGEWFWNDQFLFSCDTSAPLAANREAMWQETRMNLQSGAFGEPKDPRTLLLFWGRMERLHYPNAAETKAFLEERLQQEQMAAQAQAAAMPGGGAGGAEASPDESPRGAPGIGGVGEFDPELLRQIDEKARADAMRDSGRGR